VLEAASITLQRGSLQKTVPSGVECPNTKLGSESVAPMTKQTFYGWKIVWAILVQLTFTSGLSFYNHAIYLNALAAQPNFDVQSASAAVSIFFLSGGFAGLYVAKLVQEYDPRLSITLGALIASLSLCALPFVANLVQLFAVYVVFGVGFAASALIPATTLVTRWFQRRRAVALSLASTGLSLGGVLLTPFSAFVVDTLGFRQAMPLLASLFVLGVIPVALIWLRPDPESMGLLPDGDSPEQRQNNSKMKLAPDIAKTAENGLTFKQACRKRFFWGTSLAYVFTMLAQVGGIAHQYGLAREQLDDAQTALVVAILPVASIVGRLIGGWVVERGSIKVFTGCMMLLQAGSLSMLAGGFSIVTLCLGLFLFGTSVGNLLMLQPLILAEAFGAREYARIFSVSNLLSSMGTAIGPALLGFVYVASDNRYMTSYVVASAAGFAGLMLFVSGGRLAQDESSLEEK